VHVEVNGGQRKPAEPPEIAAWHLLRAAIDAEGPTIVGVCGGCSQPLVSESADAKAVVWPLQTPEGLLQIDTSVRSPAGPLTTDDAERLILDTYAEAAQPGQALFSGVLLAIMTVPFFLWLLAGTTFFSFLYLLYRGGMAVPN
jgi:hypothetical protein